MISLGDVTPRVAPRRLARELVARSYRISRARRRDSEPRPIVVAIDESGSIGEAYSTAALSAVIACGPEIVVPVLHTNGWPTRVIDRRHERPITQDGETPMGLWREIIRRHRARRIIWIGDADGAHWRSEIAAMGVQIILIDTHGAQHLGAPTIARDAEASASIHIVGVNSAERLLYALRLCGSAWGRPLIQRR